MLCLGSVMVFRWEKYRFVLVMISFSAFHFCNIVAVNATLAFPMGNLDITGFDVLKFLLICWRYLDKMGV